MASLVVASEIEQIPVILDFVRAVCYQAGLDDEATFACELATDEACANIIEHAYGADSEGEIRIDCWQQQGALVIQFRDQGRPFAPEQVGPPDFTEELADREIGGLGLHFMRSLMDDVRFEFDDSGNTLTMSKRISS